MIARLFLCLLLVFAVVSSEPMVCSKFGYNWAAEIRCLRALLSQCKRSASNREVRKVPHQWSEHSNNFVSTGEKPRPYNIVPSPSTSTTTTTSPTIRMSASIPDFPDVNTIIGNLTEHFEIKLRKFKEVLQMEQQRRISALQVRFESDIKTSEAKAEKKLADLKKKHELEVKELKKRLDLLGMRAYVHDRNEFIFVQHRKSWYEAEEDCISWGGHLASISDEQENSFVRGILRAESAWIGVNDVQVENVFVNSDQTLVSYKNFQDGEPDNSNHNENCVAIGSSGKWADAFCLVTKPFVCKR